MYTQLLKPITFILFTILIQLSCHAQEWDGTGAVQNSYAQEQWQSPARTSKHT